jgi:hypothetical protein
MYFKVREQLRHSGYPNCHFLHKLLPFYNQADPTTMSVFAKLPTCLAEQRLSYGLKYFIAVRKTPFFSLKKNERNCWSSANLNHTTPHL